jgi:tRNA pseudouridine55 synthase
MDLEKTYEFDVRLGVSTDTADAEGEVVSEVPCPDLPRERIEQAAAGFVGSYRMTPPAYSAVKHGGRRLYEMARAGEAPAARERTVQIHAFDVASVSLPTVTCRVRCSRGTYVRSLATDLGAVLGLPAHITRLVRTAVGPFALADAFPSAKLAAGEVDELEGIPLESALSFLPGVVLSRRSSQALLQGILPERQDVVRLIGSPGEDAPLRMLDESGALIAVGRRHPAGEHDRLKLVDTYRLYADPSVAPGAPRTG